GVKARQLVQRDLFQRATNGGIDALPRGADAALPLDAALAGSTAAFGDGDGTFENIENLCRRNLLGTPRQPVAALRTSRGKHHAGALQALQTLANRRAAQPCALSQFGRGPMCGGL